MSLVARRGTIGLGGSDRRTPDRRAGPRRAVRRLVTILRRGLRPGYPQPYCTLRMPVARPGWRYRRPGKSRVTSGYTASSSSRPSVGAPRSSSCRRRPRDWSWPRPARPELRSASARLAGTGPAGCWLAAADRAG